MNGHGIKRFKKKLTAEMTQGGIGLFISVLHFF